MSKAYSRRYIRGMGFVHRPLKFLPVMRRKPPLGYPRGFRRFGGPPRGWGANAKASRALMLIRKFKREEERKEIQTTVNLQVAIAGGAGQVQLLNGLSQGTTSSTRIGNKISMEGCAFKLTLLSTGAETGWSARVMFTYCRSPDGAASAWSVGANGVCFADDINALYDISGSEKGKHQVLYDKTINFRDSERCQTISGYIPLNGQKAQYDLGNAGTIADMSRGSIYVMINTKYNAAAVDLDGYTRIRFTDA